MWAQLGMAGLKSLADNQNRKQDIASNVITQKYSPWTGQRADFSSQGKNSSISNLIAGYGAGALQDKLDAKEAAEKMAEVKAEVVGNEANSSDAMMKAMGTPPKTSAFAHLAQPQAPVSGPSRGPASAFDSVASNPNLMIFPERGGAPNQMSNQKFNPWAQYMGGY